MHIIRLSVWRENYKFVFTSIDVGTSGTELLVANGDTKLTLTLAAPTMIARHI